MRTPLLSTRTSALTLVAVIAMSCWSFVPAAEEPGKVALLVGINNYNRRKLEDRPLRFAERDVQELAVVLEGQKFAVRTLTGPEATKANIEEALTGLLKGPKKEIVVVAFAGHGMQLPLKDEGGNLVRDAQGRELSDAFFCPFDAVAGDGSTMISLTRLVERLDNEGGTNLFLVDACRDDPDPYRGLGKRSLSGDELVGRLPGNSAILFSCSKGQQALEHEQAGGGHGVFFQQVIEGLRGAAADTETGEVGWEDLVGYVRKRVNRLARELDPEGARKADERFSGNLQTPQQITNLVATPILARPVKPREPVMQARQFLDLCQAGKYTEATTNFDAKMKEVLGPAKLEELWKKLAQQLGPIEKMGPARTAKIRSSTRVKIRCDFKSMPLDALVSFNAQGQIEGFFLNPAEKTADRASTH